MIRNVIQLVALITFNSMATAACKDLSSRCLLPVLLGSNAGTATIREGAAGDRGGKAFRTFKRFASTLCRLPFVKSLTVKLEALELGMSSLRCSSVISAEQLFREDLLLAMPA